MNTLKTIALSLASTLVFALPASADNTGQTVTGTIAFGPNGGYGGQYWSPQNAVIGAGLEYSYADSANMDTVDFTATQMIIRDQVFIDANGWKMTFATAGGFSSLSLVSSTFMPGLTYSLTGGVIEVNWAGTGTGPADYTAVFNVAGAVPEPETYAMLVAGLAVVSALARRRSGGKTRAV